MSKREMILDGATIVAAVSVAIIAVTIVIPRSAGDVVITAGGEARIIPDWEQYASTERRIGPASARVTLVEWGDYQCPACRTFQPHLKAILRKFDGEVAFVYRHWPLDRHQFAYPAARAAECAGDQGRFFEFHDGLYESSDWLGDAFRRIATEAGVTDIDRFLKCASNDEPVGVIERDVAAALDLDARGTPTLLINDRLLAGVPDSTQLQTIIEEVLNES